MENNLTNEERLLQIVEAKKTSKRICASYLWLIAIQSVLTMFFVLAFLRLTWGFTDKYLGLTSCGMIVAVAVSTIFVAKRYQKILNFKIPMATKGDWDAKFIIKAALVFIGLSCFVSALMNLVVLLLESSGINYPIVNPINFTDDIFSNVAVVIMTCVSAPIFEELYFRGILVHGLKKHGYVFAILASTTLFAFSHQGLPSVAGIFVASLGLAYISIRTNSIIPGMIIHAINNIFATSEVFLMETNFIYAFYAFEVIAIIYALGFVFKHRHDIKAYINEHKSIEFPTFFMSWQGVVCIILLIGSILPANGAEELLNILS